MRCKEPESINIEPRGRGFFSELACVKNSVFAKIFCPGLQSLDYANLMKIKFVIKTIKKVVTFILLEFPSRRNQSINLLCYLIDWFPCDGKIDIKVVDVTS